MKSYKGYAIDGVYFQSQAQIDAFIRESLLNSFKAHTEDFELHRNYSSAEGANRVAEKLVSQYGMSWEEIEELEAQILSALQ